MFPTTAIPLAGSCTLGFRYNFNFAGCLRIIHLRIVPLRIAHLLGMRRPSIDFECILLHQIMRSKPRAPALTGEEFPPPPSPGVRRGGIPPPPNRASAMLFLHLRPSFPIHIPNVTRSGRVILLFSSSGTSEFPASSSQGTFDVALADGGFPLPFHRPIV